MNENKHIEILEKILASNDSIRKVVTKCEVAAVHFSNEKTRERRVAQLIIGHYSNLCGLSGGASGIPALIPFVGSLYSIFGASTADAIAALKFEVEMSLALTSHMGYDIDDPRERKLAIITACAALEDVFKRDRPTSVFDIVDSAMSEYSTRQLSKTMAKLFARAILALVAKRWTRYFPLVGIAIGGAINAVMTAHTGHGCYLALCRRRRRDAKAAGLDTSKWEDIPEEGEDDAWSFKK